MLLILIPAVWCSALFLGLAMCRLAANSDRAQSAVIRQCLAAIRRSQNPDIAVARLREQLSFDPQRGEYRATG